MTNQAVELANVFGRWLFQHFWQMSTELAILAAVVYAAISVLRIRSSALRHLFWCLLLIKPLATFAVASPVSLYWFLRPVERAVPAYQPAAYRHAVAPPTQPTVAPAPAAPTQPLSTPRPIAAYRASLDRYGLLAASWVAGCGAFFLRLVVGFAYVSFLRRTSVPVSGGLESLVREASSSLGIRQRVSIAASTVSHGPVLAGVLRPTILIPEDLATGLTDSQMRSIIAHELVHVQRRDNLILLAQRLAEMVFFFHPVVWLAGKMMRHEAESACDDVVLGRLGNSSIYADSLTRVAEVRFSLTQKLLVNTFAAAETNFTRRLRRIMDSPVRRATLRLTMASVAALVLIALVGLPRVAARKPAAVKEITAGADSSRLVTDTSEMGSAAMAYPERVVLENVPKVAYKTDRWRFTPFCNALNACLKFLGEEEQYDYLMAVSGAGFRTNWSPKMWDGGNSDILGMTGETLEPMRRAFQAAGYDMLPVAKGDGENWAEALLRNSAERVGGELSDEAGFRRHIIESIAERGKPVIAFGIIGPPEAAVIAGYDEGGDVLIGWNVFQGKTETEPSGYFRVRDWYERTRGLLLFGEKVAPPPASELNRSALLWAAKVLRTTGVGNSKAGPAAFDAWAADMSNDEYFPEGNDKVLHGRLGCHYDAMQMQAERKGSAEWLAAVAGTEPAMSEHLLAAAAALQEGGAKHGVQPHERDKIARLADPDVRREVAESILATRDAYSKTADHIEQALLVAGVPAEDIPYLGDDPLRPASAGPEDRARQVVLEGVPKVGFGVVDGHVGMTPLAACMRACLEYMGDDLGFEAEDKYPRDPVYAYLMGTTGAAFRLTWKEGWQGDNVASWLLGPHPSDIFRRAFAAVGYEQIASGSLAKEERDARFREMVLTSIRDEGRPVIAHGLIGPPEEAIIAGYGEGGEVVYGWSFFQDDAIGWPGVEFLPNGYYRRRNWVENTWSMMAFGDKTGTPDRRETYIDALQWALEVMRVPSLYKDRANGIAAYDVWAEHILRDDEMEKKAPDDPFTVHSDAVDVVAEGRHYASVFLKQAAEVLPEAQEQLLAASDCCKAEHDLMWDIWRTVGGNQRGKAEKEAFLKPDVRRRIVPIIHQARDKDIEAADLIEKALQLVGADAEGEDGASSSAPSRPPISGGSGETEAPKMLEGLVFPRRSVSHLGCVKTCLDYLGKDVSWHWLYGGTGHAFIINMHIDVDLEAATAFDPSMVFDLAPNLGYRVSGFAVNKPEAGDAYRDRQREAWDFVRAAIDRNRPCYGWELKAPYGDFWLITGYDDVGYYYAGWETGGPTPWEELGDQFIDHLEVRSIDLCDPASDKKVVVDALSRAIDFNLSGTVSTDDDAHQGPAAFEVWSKALDNGTALRDHHTYLAGVWLECREEGVAFLREVRGRFADLPNHMVDEAVAHYEAVCQNLQAAQELHPDREKRNWRDTFRSSEAAAIIRRAGAADHRGLYALGEIVRTLGGKCRKVPPVPRDRVEIGNVGKVGWAEFPHALVAALGCLGENVDYDFVMGVSGMAFRNVHTPAKGDPPKWFPGDYSLRFITEGPEEPIRRAFEAVGYTFESHPRGTLEEDTKRIVASIDAGRPIIVDGGWDAAEYSLVYGYADGGNTTIGNSAFKQKYELENWHEKAKGGSNYRGAIEIGKKIDAPPPAETYRRAIQFAVEHAKAGVLNGKHLGLEAYTRRSADLQNPALFPDDDPGRLWFTHLCLLCGDMIVGERKSAAAFLRNACEVLPEQRPHLERAAELYEQVATVQVGRLNALVPPNQSKESQEMLLNAETRKAYADILLEMRDLEAEAIRELEKVLAAFGE